MSNSLSSAPHPKTLAIDIGGTGIKAIVLDESGETISPRVAEPTPKPATPPAVLDVIARLAQQSPPADRIAVGFPGVVRDGVTLTAPNLDPSWRGFAFGAALEERLKIPARVCNDADVQGFGAINGEGLELVITLGTGVGSALFIDGILVPNLELAHHPFRDGKTYEQWLGLKALTEEGEVVWRQKLDESIALWRQTFNFDVLYLGGGNAMRLEAASLPKDVHIVPNLLGLLGGIALWTPVHGTSLTRAPHSLGAYCVIHPESATPAAEANVDEDDEVL